MCDAIQCLVQCSEYRRFEFQNDIFAERLADREVWSVMERITKKAGPVLLLLRLADGNGATLSKLKGTLEYIRSVMVDEGDNTLEDQISTAFHNRAPELECDISNAAYVLDPQFVNKSRNADTMVMNSFWKVSRALDPCNSWGNPSIRFLIQIVTIYFFLSIVNTERCMQWCCPHPTFDLPQYKETTVQRRTTTPLRSLLTSVWRSQGSEWRVQCYALMMTLLGGDVDQK